MPAFRGLRGGDPTVTPHPEDQTPEGESSELPVATPLPPGRASSDNALLPFKSRRSCLPVTGIFHISPFCEACFSVFPWYSKPTADCSHREKGNAVLNTWIHDA